MFPGLLPRALVNAAMRLEEGGRVAAQAGAGQGASWGTGPAPYLRQDQSPCQGGDGVWQATGLLSPRLHPVGVPDQQLLQGGSWG